VKRKISDLAVFGGSPAFSEKLHVGLPNIGNRERLLERINDMLDRRWLSNDGPFSQELERRIAEMLGVKHCVAMCNGTVALEIAIRALGLADEVIVPSFTFIATAHALEWQRIRPVFCDVDMETHSLDPGCIEKMITPRTTGIVGVHLWGETHHIEALEHIAKRRNLRLLFDAAHAFASSYKGTMVGNFGDAEVFSFHATKFFNTFEGGAIVTNRDDLAEKIRLMRNFGFSRQNYDEVVYVGTNGKLNEASAAMGLTSLESLDEFIATNRSNHAAYRQELDGIPGIRLRRSDDTQGSNYQYVIVEVDESVTNVSRDTLVKILHAENVLARRYFYPGCHGMEPYRSYQPHAHLLLPNTLKLVHRVMALPTGTGVKDSDIGTIGQLLRLTVSESDEVVRRLGANSSVS